MKGTQVFDVTQIDKVPAFSLAEIESRSGNNILAIIYATVSNKWREFPLQLDKFCNFPAAYLFLELVTRAR